VGLDLCPAGTLSTTFALDPNQPYFAYAFKGEVVPDTLRITFINQDGTNYNDPIVVEYLTSGKSVPGDSDLSVNTIPKRLETGQSTSYYAKPINLTKFTINAGDYLILEVIPNSGITQTSWDLYFTCLENFDCDTCLSGNTPYKISASTLTYSVDPTCNILNVQAKVIGCPTFDNDDIFKYMHSVTNQYLPTFTSQDGTPYYPYSNYFGLAGFNGNINSSFNLTCSGVGYGPAPTCQATGNTINVTKVGSVITITCSAISDRDAYYNSYIATYNSTGWSPTPPLPTTLQYYRYITFQHINPFSLASTCGDNQYSVNFYNIHPSSTVTIGGGPGSYTMTINMASITNQLPQTNCDNCYGLANNYVQQITTSISSPNINTTTNNGLRFDNPFPTYTTMSSYVPTNPLSYLGGSGVYIPLYSNQTLPYSGSPLTVIPSLSATTCDFSWMTFNNFINPIGSKEVQYYGKILASYWAQMTDPNNPTYFNLWFEYPSVLIYQVNSTYPTGNIVNPLYFI